MLRGQNRYKKSQRHVWLRFGDIDIDITANQFSSTNKTVFFEYESEWHKRYEVYDIEIPDTSFNQFDEDCKYDLLTDYRNIVKNIYLLSKSS